MSIEGLLVGLLYIVLYGVVACIIVWIILYGAAALGFPIPEPIPRLLWAVVAILCLIMLVSLLFGWRPGAPFRAEVPGGAPAVLSAAATIDL
jgi:hypothetical protein